VSYYILKGDKASGKTTTLNKFIKDNNLKTSGVLCFSIGTDKFLFNLETKEEFKLTADCKNNESIYKIGHYCFSKKAFEKGNEIFLSGNKKSVELLIIDEAGFLELENKGFHSALSVLTVEKNVKAQNILIVVRSFLVDDIVEKYFNNNNVTILTIDSLDTIIS